MQLVFSTNRECSHFRESSQREDKHFKVSSFEFFLKGILKVYISWRYFETLIGHVEFLCALRKPKQFDLCSLKSYVFCFVTRERELWIYGRYFVVTHTFHCKGTNYTTQHVKVMPLKLVPLIREVFVKGNSADCRVFLFDDGTRAHSSTYKANYAHQLTAREKQHWHTLIENMRNGIKNWTEVRHIEY